MFIKDVFSGITDINPIENHLVQGISVDPKRCKTGYVYVAETHETVDSSRLGLRLDGRQYIPLAIANGANTILTTPGEYLNTKEAQFIFHSNPLSVLGLLYKRFYQFSYPKHIALVTGTDGKTSTVNFCKKFLSFMNKPSCSIGNLGAITNDEEILWSPDFNLTVPDTLNLHEILTKCSERNIDYLIAEATSHALYEHRLSHIPVQIGVMTNLTPEHLDFHKTMQAYFQVKMRLFEEVLLPGSHAIINADGKYYKDIEMICQKRKHKVISIGYKGKTIQIIKITPNKYGQMLDFKIGKKIYLTQVNLFGEFQIYNLMSSLGILLALDFDIKDLLPLIPKIDGVEGRFNTIGFTPAGGQVIVDFAHTMNGLRHCIMAAKQFTTGKIYLIIGSRREVDINLSQQMAILAEQLVDQLVITDGHSMDNNLQALREIFLQAAPKAWEIPERSQAIKGICKLLNKGDTLLITGMGHENHQWIANDKIPYSDKQCVLNILKEMSHTEK